MGGIFSSSGTSIFGGPESKIQRLDIGQAPELPPTASEKSSMSDSFKALSWLIRAAELVQPDSDSEVGSEGTPEYIAKLNSLTDQDPEYRSRVERLTLDLSILSIALELAHGSYGEVVVLRNEYAEVAQAALKSTREVDNPEGRRGHLPGNLSDGEHSIDS